MELLNARCPNISGRQDGLHSQQDDFKLSQVLQAVSLGDDCIYHTSEDLYCVRQAARSSDRRGVTILCTRTAPHTCLPGAEDEVLTDGNC